MSEVALSSVAVMRAGRRVLEDVSATFPAGRLTVVIGPNGAGKSTLLAVAAGLLVPDAGSVTLAGQALGTFTRQALARRRAYLPQSPRVEWPISVERVVALGLAAHLPAFGGLPAVWRPGIEEALRRHDLIDLRDRPATELSGGELARVMLARATVGKPELLLVDEPTAGLDPRHVRDAGRRLRGLADDGCTVVVALHDLDLALAIADQAVAMKDGRVMASGSADGVFTPAILASLYDIDVSVRRDGEGATIRFTG